MELKIKPEVLQLSTFFNCQMEQFIFRNIYVHTYAYLLVTTINEIKGHKLEKKTRSGLREVLG